MKLPNAGQAVVYKAKLTQYLLDLTHEDGGPKAVFFLGHGFTLEDWHELRAALLQHALEGEVVNSEEREFGVLYVIEGDMMMVDGLVRFVRSVWGIDFGSTIPRLLSAMPRERRRSKLK